MEKNWGLVIHRIDFINTGSNAAFKITDSKNKKFFLKICSLQNKSSKEKKSTLNKYKNLAEILYFLGKKYRIKNISCFIPAVNNEWIIRKEIFFFILNPFFEGFHPEENMSNLNYMELTKFFTKLHAAHCKNFLTLEKENFDISYALGLQTFLKKNNNKTGVFKKKMIDRIKNQKPVIKQKIKELWQLHHHFLNLNIKFVLTHGDGHHFNILQNQGKLYLIDWDSIKLAPRERDLWHYSMCPSVIHQYQILNPDLEINMKLCRYYRILRFLEDIRFYLEEKILSSQHFIKNKENFLSHWGWLEK